jgi:DNA-binding CsgD family transcriptional regulator
MTAKPNNVIPIGITLDDLHRNQQGQLSELQQHTLSRHRLIWVAGAVGFALICGTLVGSFATTLLMPSVVSWPEFFLWLPLGMVWLWLLLPSLTRWRHTNRDIASKRVAVLEGLVQCEFSLGFGLIRLPRYSISIGERTFSVDKRTFFQFKNQERYRVYYAPTASILLGAVQVVANQPLFSQALVEECTGVSQTETPSAGETIPVQPVIESSDSDNYLAEIESLTQQEKAIVQLISQGLSNKEIAKELSLSTNTIKMYTSQLYRKLGVRRRTEAVAKARQLHLL